MSTRRWTLGVALAMGLGAVVAAQQSGSPVADAARRGDQTTVRTLLKSGADASTPQADGMTPLHWAAERGDAALAEMLTRAGANLTAITRLGHYTPLHLAARNGSAPVVRIILLAGASVSTTTSSGATALHLAAESGSVDAVNALLDGKADINARESESGQTPLIFAASEGHVAVIKALLKRGADANIATRLVNLQKQQAMDRQSSTLRRQVLAAVAPAGVAPTPSQEQAAVQAAREFYATGKLPPPPAAAGGAGGGRGGGGGGAAGGGGRAAADAPAGAAAATPPNNAGPAGGAAGVGRATGGAQAAADVNTEPPPAVGAAKGGLTALHHAARSGYTSAVTALLEGGADINKKSADGNTPILTALINGEFDIAMLLVEKGADPRISGDYGVTPLWAAVNARWQPRTRFPQPQEMDYQRATYLDVMKALLEAGADPNARVKGHPWYMVYSGCGNGNCGLSSVVGSTAFWRAAYGTDVEAMKLLVKYGADPNIPTMAGGGGGRGGGGAGGRAGGGGAAGGAAGGLDDGATGTPAGQPAATGGRNGAGGAQAGPAGAAGGAGAADLQAALAAGGRQGGAQAGRGGGGGAGGRGGGAGGGGGAAGPDPSGLPPVPSGGPGVFPLHAAAGAEYGEGYAGNAHRHAPDSWLTAVKFLVEELGADVNQRDDGGYTPMHHAAARGDNETILYLVSKGADVKAISRRNQTTVDMANGPVSRISPYPDTIALLEKLGAKNSHKCASCAP